MTTFTLQGYTITDQNDVTTSVAPTTLRLTVPEGTNSFTYSLVPPAPSPGDFPEVDVNLDIYNAELSGQSFTLDTIDGITLYLGEINWSGGTTYALSADLPGQPEDTIRIFFIGGATPPALNTPQDVDNFIATFTAPPGQAGGAFAPGSTISLNSVPGVSITENDTILGTTGDDILNGGLGNDSIVPDINDGFDQITPGRGNDTINFVDSQFPSFYELNYGDLTAAVTLDVDLVADTGTISAGGQGTDTLLNISQATAFATSDGTQVLLGNTADTINITTEVEHWFGVAPGAGADSLTLDLATDSIVRIDLSQSGDGGPTQAANVNIAGGVISNDGYGSSDTVSVTGNGTLEVRLTQFADTYVGSNGMDRVIANGGNDSMDGLGGTDLLRYDRSGVGAIEADLEAGIVTGTWDGNAFTHAISNFEDVRGSNTGSDLLVGDGNDNLLDGRGGNDTLIGNGGADSLLGRAGDDTYVIDGRVATDTVELFDNGGFNTLQIMDFPGLDGGDFYDDGAGNLVRTSFQGHTTTINGGLSSIQQVQLVSPDLATTQTPTALITDMFNATSSAFTFAGTQMADTVMAPDFADVGNAYVFLNDGNDDFTAGVGYTAFAHMGSGQDTFTGGTADDWVHGQDGNDSMDGNGGEDTMWGGDGDDTMNGGAGDDEIHATGTGADVIDGGAGFDLVTYAGASGRVLVDLQSDVSGAGFARFFTEGAGSGDTYTGIEAVTGCAFADNLRGDANDNVLNGGEVSDRLYGRAGDDELFGGTGADALYGNLGADTMTGGDDAGRTDRFIYFNASESGVGAGNRDVITDFVSGEDRIEIRRIDADITQGFKQFFDFIGDAAFSNTAGELRYEQIGGNTIVQADRDGDGAADFEIELTGLMDLIADDFLI